MSIIRYLLVPLIFCLFCFYSISAKTISVIDFGINDAQTDIDRFNVLYRAHCKAVDEKCGLSYKGINSISIEIPNNASSIPLPSCTDFANVVITVHNYNKDFFLFSSESELQELNISKKRIDKGKFRGIRQLRKGRNLLIIEDQNPWVKVRRGHTYGATRKDIFVVEDGVALNRPIQPYNNKFSFPKCYYCYVGVDSLVLKNVSIIRSDDSDARTFCFGIYNHNNVYFQNVTLFTPSSDMTGDRAIAIHNSTNVLFENVIINGTYSKPDKFGYGISMNNVWRAHFLRLNANAEWGVFGTNNVSSIVIEDSIINRIDIHCYGKDIYCVNTTFQNLYNQFSSLYGTLLFEKCFFNKFVPVLLGASYYAFSFFEIRVKDCVINVDKDRPYFIRAGIPLPPEEIREELKSVCLPNITIEDTDVKLPNDATTWSIFNVGAIPMPEMDGIEKIVLSNVTISGPSAISKVELSNRKLNTRKLIKAEVKESNFIIIDK